MHFHSNNSRSRKLNLINFNELEKYFTKTSITWANALGNLNDCASGTIDSHMTARELFFVQTKFSIVRTQLTSCSSNRSNKNSFIEFSSSPISSVCVLYSHLRQDSAWTERKKYLKKKREKYQGKNVAISSPGSPWTCFGCFARLQFTAAIKWVLFQFFIFATNNSLIFRDNVGIRFARQVGNYPCIQLQWDFSSFFSKDIFGGAPKIPKKNRTERIWMFFL